MEPISPVFQGLESIVNDHHTDVVAWNYVLVLSHGVVRSIHEVGQKVPRNVVGLVGFDPGFIHEFPSGSIDRNKSVDSRTEIGLTPSQRRYTCPA